MNTVEKNKMINIFMGLKPVEIFGRFSISKDHVSVCCDTSDETMESFSKSTKYHSDWNWLMEVVEKIENLGYPIDIIQYHSIDKQFCGVYNNGKRIVTNIAESKMEAVYNTCVEFIKWYNQQKF